ncbi:MAG: hypothetical protein LBD23_19465 [Oscillospiraceae bacterium]|jgi:energy-coupling factor transport system substrate-specific component|nr:hypothetical protein [Oscillospiraceae bacterium]
MPSSTRRLKELVIFAALGSILFISFFAMMMIPSVHVVGLLIAAYTLTYRVRALIPIYVFVMIYGILYGLSAWWIPYLYIWLPLWGMFMLAGRFQLPVKVKVPLYMLLCALHGLSFGILYAPLQAWLFGLSFQGMVAWIIAGIPFDITHAINNFAMGALIVPLSELLKKLNAQVFAS